MERIKQWWKFVIAVAALLPTIVNVWHCMSAAAKTVSGLGFVAAVIFAAWWGIDLMTMKRTAEQQLSSAKAEADRAAKEGLRKALRAATILLESLGVRCVGGRIEPREGASFTSDAREQAAVFAAALGQYPELLARLDPEPAPEGIFQVPAPAKPDAD